MSEYEKMISGEAYSAADPDLKKIRTETRKKLFEYNHLPVDRWDEQEALLKDIFGKVGKDPTVHRSFHCDYGINIEIGDDFFSNYNLVILDCAKVIIGDRVKFGPNVGIYTAGHPIHPETRAEGLEYGREVVIEDDVWIGGSVVINPGVHIGKGSVIGSGSVVTKDIPEYSIAVGNPCRVIRKITDEDKGLFYGNYYYDE